MVKCLRRGCRKKVTPQVRRRGRVKRFCSDRCRQAHAYAKEREAARIQEELRRHEWYSPAEIVEAARATMGGIDLDPASCPAANEIVRAGRFYSIADDGLAQPWSGRVWLNPPYGGHAPKFVERFREHFAAGSVAQGCLLLADHHLNTRWFAALAAFAPIGCTPEVRPQFSGKTTRPRHGSLVLGIGVDAERFEGSFAPLGQICHW
jgi:ParB family chromosome partitioning protein